MDSANQKSQALYSSRDALLAKSMDLYHSYRDELATTPDPQRRQAIHATYAARFAGINDAFAVLRQAEPGITTQIDVEQYRRSAERQAEQEARLGGYEQAISTPVNQRARGLASTATGAGFSLLKSHLLCTLVIRSCQCSQAAFPVLPVSPLRGYGFR
jgi:hypothetical protein